LGVETSATSEEIKRAFKTKAFELHPDRNRAPDATQKFQFLNDAFQELSDPGSRARYDAGSFATAEKMDTARGPDPIVCSRCGKISAQPRYAIYSQVLSFLVFTRRRVSQGVFCSACGAKVAHKASVATWVLGWWGLPWGPIWSIPALYWNMLGGKQPAINNFKILGRQALYFRSIGRPDIARAVALDALTFEKRLTPTEKAADSGIGQLAGAIGNIFSLARGTAVTLPNVWGVGSRAFRLQAIGAAILTAAVAVAVTVLCNVPKVAYRHVPPTDEATVALGETEVVAPPAAASPDAGWSLTPSVPRSNIPGGVRAAARPAAVFDQPPVPYPPTGQMRRLWQHGSGPELAPLKVLTAANGPNYYVKLVNVQTAKPTLILFIRSGETASAKIPVGTYLFKTATGEKWYGEGFLFDPNTTYTKADAQLDFRVEGDQVLGHTIELIAQVNGNFTETSIAPSDF
jgi:hypothetical protein